MKGLEDITLNAAKFYKRKRRNNWRLNYHLEAPFGLVNDPNGLAQYKGKYYIFFQWNPFRCEHKFKHWGLFTTEDFINYSYPKAVLAPTNRYDKNGVYSGSGYAMEDRLELLYTGNVKNKYGKREAYQCRAICDEYGNVEKKGIVVGKIPKGYTAYFRDPNIFERNGKYYFMIGAQTKDLKGRALLYSSENFEKWNYEGEIKTSYDNFGYIWECPALLNIEGKDVLIFSPQGLEREEFRYQNIYQAGYIVGELNFDTLEFKHGEFKELDFGTDFYAPQSFKDEKGRVIMFGWMGLPEEEQYHPTVNKGWVHCLTMPRELKLINGKLIQKPLIEMKELRKDKIESLEKVEIVSWKSDNVMENSYELVLDVEKYESSLFEIKLALGEIEYASLKIDFTKNYGVFDNSAMAKGLKSFRKFKLNNLKDKIKVHIFMDKSAVEIFLNDGETVVSSRIYPKEGSNGLEIISYEGKLKIDKLDIWSLGGFKFNE